MSNEYTTKLQRRMRCAACKREFDASYTICSEDGTILTPTVAENLLGKTIAGKYEILAELGCGGMSIVYKARHLLMDRIVAIKVLNSQLVNDRLNLKRFQQEAQAASHLAHPNIIVVHEYGIVEGTSQPFIVMDYLVGKSLSEVLKEENYFDEKRAVQIFLQACDALEHAHQKGVLHRDLKSSNIILTDRGGRKDIVTVVDFGIAKFMPSSGKQPERLTQTGEIFGSPIYMSPEQCLGQPLDARSDIYSMGVLMYESLTGLPPLMGNTIIDTMQQHVSTKPVSFNELRRDIGITPQMETIVFKALEKAPAMRFQSMQEFYYALEAAALSLGITGADNKGRAVVERPPASDIPVVATPIESYSPEQPAIAAKSSYAASRFGKKGGVSELLHTDSAKQSLPKGSDSAKIDGEKINSAKDNIILVLAAIALIIVSIIAFWFAVHH